MRATWRIGGALGLTWAAMGGSSVARADDSAAAQALFDQAKKAMTEHRYAEACPKLEESLRLQEALGTLLNLAECYERQGKLASAWSKFLEVSAKARAAGQTERARIGHDRAAALAPRLSNLAVDVPSTSHADGLEVRRDATVVGPAEWGAPIPADPGPHTIEASAPGRKAWSQTVTVTEGATTTRVALPELQRLPPAPPSASHDSTDQGFPRMKIAAIAAAGVGVVGVGVGTAFGILSKSRHDAALGECPSNPCTTRTGQGQWNDAVNFGNVSTVAFVVGGVGLAAGAVLWLTAPKPAEHGTPVAAITVGPGSVAVQGAW